MPLVMQSRRTSYKRYAIDKYPSPPSPQPNTAVRGVHWWQHTWLRCGGSLTARLSALGAVKVHVQHQGRQRLQPQEHQAIGCNSGHVREVILSVDDCPMVWARSVTNPRALKGPWQAMKGLGNHALAELLFGHMAVQRGQLHTVHLTRHGQTHSRCTRQWHRYLQMTGKAGTTQAPRAARASVFWHKGQALHVMESFSDHISRYKRPL
jgi:chorismate lyase